MKNTALALTVALGLLELTVSSAFAETRKFNLFTVETSGLKMWVPSTIVVKKGDDVELTLASKLGPGTMHGFTIEGYKIVEAADDKPKVIKFTADKAGIFPFRCHLHMPHLGGQLVVLD